MGKITEKELLTFTKSVYYLLNGKTSLIDTLTIVSQNYKNEIKLFIKIPKKENF